MDALIPNKHTENTFSSQFLVTDKEKKKIQKLELSKSSYLCPLNLKEDLTWKYKYSVTKQK